LLENVENGRQIYPAGRCRASRAAIISIAIECQLRNAAHCHAQGLDFGALAIIE
jgi:hypothetical protein